MNWENYSAFYGISYLCTSHECNGFAGTVSKYTPPFQLADKLSLPSLKNIS